MALQIRGSEARDGNTAEDWVDHEELSDGRSATSRREIFDHQGKFKHSQPGATMLLRKGNAAQPGLADGRPDLRRESFVTIQIAPIFQTELLTNPARRMGDHRLVGGQGKIHLTHSRLMGRMSSK